jgi:multidrug resistance efflux pump
MSGQNDLKASGVVWKRLKKILLTGTLVLGGGSVVAYSFSGDSFVLSADGLVARERVTIASPYDGRLKQVLVQPGEAVVAGQKVAVVESATITRTLADLSTEKARIGARIAHLEGRKQVVAALVPVAEKTAAGARAFLNELTQAKNRGLALDRSIHETSANFMTAEERALSLKAEQQSLDIELQGTKVALVEVTTTYDSLQTMYNDGILTAPVSGTVGSTVGSVGEVLNGSNTKVAQVYTGESYALAYLPDSYLFDLREGQPVAVKARGRTLTANIERVLPVTEALPPEFQLPNRARNRGQLVRIDLEDQSHFAVDQKVNVTSCYVTGCKTGITEIVRKVGNSVLTWANEAVHEIRVTQALTRAIRMGDE